jgi:hypothetical protein
MSDKSKQIQKYIQEVFYHTYLLSKNELPSSRSLAKRTLNEPVPSPVLERRCVRQAKLRSFLLLFYHDIRKQGAKTSLSQVGVPNPPPINGWMDGALVIPNLLCEISK